MKLATLALAVAGTFATHAFAALAVGDQAPAFKVPAALDGKPVEFSLPDTLKKGPVVVYFYPSAFTQGCNLQAHTFSVNHDKFAAVKTTVIGVSLDSMPRLIDFSKDPDYCAGKIPVASDPEGSVAKAYGLAVREGRAGMKDTRGAEIEHGFAERTTFVVGKDGKIAATITGVAPDENVRQALAAAQALK
jgi:peroxiredoxin